MESITRKDRMPSRTLGTNGPVVSGLGFGCMGLSYGIGPGVDRSQGVTLIREAFELGVTFSTRPKRMAH